MTQAEIISNPEFKNKIMLASIVVSRNVVNESTSTPNHDARARFAKVLLQNPTKVEFVSSFTVLSASRYDPTDWETKIELDKNNDCQFLITQVFEEAAGI
jgi:hypothetical protein